MKHTLTILFLIFFNQFSFSQPKIELSKKELNFDTLYTGQGAKDTVYVRNIGNKNLVISNVHCSDGGSVVYSWTNVPIAPNDSGIIVAGFHPNNTGIKGKTVTIESNDEIKYISLKAYFK